MTNYFPYLKPTLPKEIEEALKASTKKLSKIPRKTKKYRLWQRSEDEFLLKFYPHVQSEILANILNRSTASVQIRATRHLGIKKSREFWKKWQHAKSKIAVLKRGDRLWTPEEIRKLREAYPKKSNWELSKMFGRTVMAIILKARELKLTKENSQTKKGKKGEKIAKKFFLDQKWTILKRGNNSSSYDFIVRHNREVLAVNVKYGKTIVEPLDNLKRLLKTKIKPALLYITPQQEIYLMKIERIK